MTKDVRTENAPEFMIHVSVNNMTLIESQDAADFHLIY